MTRIRQATEADAPIIGKFVYSLMVEMQHESPNMNEAFYTARAKELLEGSLPNYVFIAEESSQPRGFITLGVSSGIYAEGTFGIINELYVVPELRGMGVGKQLLDEAKQFALSKGWTRLEVSAILDSINSRSRPFYQRESFVAVGTRLKFETRNYRRSR